MTLSTRPNLPPVLAQVKVAPRHVVCGVCAASAGVHAALVPEHLLESRPLGLAFAVDAVLLVLGALVVRDPRHDRWAPATTASLLVATVLAYLLSRSAGIPWLIPHRETLDLLGFIVSTAEVVAVLAAVRLITREEP